MPATNVHVAVLIADEDEIDSAIDSAIATMTDEAIFSLLTAPQDVPVILSIPAISSAIEAAIERAIDLAIDDAVRTARAAVTGDVSEPDIEVSATDSTAPTKGIFPTSYSSQAWQVA